VENWFYLLGILVLVGVGLDLLRRTRTANRDSLEMDFRMQQGLGNEDPLTAVKPDEEESDSVFSEPGFPSGGARKIERKTTGQAGGSKKASGLPKQRREPKISVDPLLEDTQKISSTPTVSSGASDKEEALVDRPVPMLMETESEQVEEGQQETLFSDDDPFMGGSSPILSRPRVVPRKPKTSSDTEEVIVINVMALESNGFNGASLLETVLSCGLRFGEMNIFHYHVSDEDDTSLFSMVNILKPGIFDLNSMSSFQTPGVSLFMVLPLQNENISAMETFDRMLGCARKIANNLNGELRDEKRSVMTGQTIEHCRQRISEFSRKTLSRSGKYHSS
jgi:cell division protein ZipA